jgi:hypothetical protein
MSKRGIVVGALATGLLLVGGGGPAAANVLWCSGDPPIQIVTPGGNRLMVNNMLYVSQADKDNVKLVTHDATAAPDGKGGTMITVRLTFPQNFSDAYVVSNNYRFSVQDAAGTNGGATGNNVVTLHLDVPIA